MAAPEPLVIVGAGGHGRELLDIVEALNASAPTFEFVGFLDDGHPDADVLARRRADLVGRVERLTTLDVCYLIGIGSPETRQRIDAYASSLGREAAQAIHPEASLGSDVRLGPGAVLAAGARVTTNVSFGRHVHLNVNATVSHDCVLGDYVILNPGATVCGNAVLGDGVTIGTGATVIQGRTVGNGTVVGAGAVVVSDLPPGITAVGVPARPLSLRPRASRLSR
jgi:sugar O-acyltransferase (sialic acid O-acetyltransferase NeuD family)